MSSKTVCVTGAGGFIASWIVLKLLQRGYKVHGTVRDPGNDKKYGHLKKLEGAEERLTLFKADVLDYDSLVPAIRGCDAVFHTACPFFWSFESPEDVLRPAMTGTENVLKACSQEKIKRVVMTSSGAAVFMDPNRPKDEVVDESSWSDSDSCRKHELWYILAKNEAEKLAWKLSKDHNLDLVVVCPVYTFGPLLQATLNTSNEYLKNFIDGSSESYTNCNIPVVDVRDVATAHILAAEDEAASGRYFCVAQGISIQDLLEALKQKFPDLPYPQTQLIAEGSLSWMPSPEKVSNKKTKAFIKEFIPLEQTLEETVASFRNKGFL